MKIQLNNRRYRSKRSIKLQLELNWGNLDMKKEEKLGEKVILNNKLIH